ncbi:MAG: PRC-barrel domain-containing protein [Trueperaceae bacterium]|nr:MAG: PRC-barrel domain-containing protein [Trueperaceae bacterium]
MSSGRAPKAPTGTRAWEQAPETYVLLGRLGKTFQLAGGLHFYPLGPGEARAITTVDEVFVTGLGPSKIRQVMPRGNAFILHLERVKRVDRAKTLVHGAVFADRAALPNLSETFYFDLLIGSRVTVDGKDYGEVTDVMDAGGQVVVEVKTSGITGDRNALHRVLVPLTAPYVTVDERTIHISSPPAGLLDDGDEKRR